MTSNRSSASTVSTREETFGVLELGTNSLKLHLYSRDLRRYEPFRIEWEVGFEVYSTGRLSEQVIEQALDQVKKLLKSCPVDRPRDLVGIATGVFEDAENTTELLGLLDNKLSIPVRILTGHEQAKLLFYGFRGRVSTLPSMLFDLGCGRLEMVYLGDGERYLHETLPLGVIRIQHLASFGSGSWDDEAAERYIRENLRSAKSISLQEIHGTGGSVRAISQVARTEKLTREVLERVERETRSHGPRRFLSPRRQEIFLPGVIMVRHLLEHVGAEVVHHHKVDLGVVLMDRLRPVRRALGGELRRAIMDREIDLFS